MEFVNNDVVEPLSIELVEMLHPTERLNGRKQDICVRCFFFTRVQAKSCLWSNSPEGVHRLGEDFFSVCDEQDLAKSVSR